MTSIDEILRAVDGVRTRDIAGRLTARGAGLGTKAAALPDDSLGLYSITNAPEIRSGGFGGALIVANKFENEPELFVGPFMQLGTFLEIENPVIRFITDAVFDPLNLVVPGTSFLATQAGKIAKVATGAMHAAEAAGKTVKTLDNVLDALEKGVHLATQSPEYLGRLRKAATMDTSLFRPVQMAKHRKEWKKLVQEGLDAETTETGKELLHVLRDNREGLKDIHKLAKDHGAELIGEGMQLQPTLAGRLLAGQVNPLIRIERPFARTRASLTKQGVIGENSFFGIKRGDLYYWSPTSDKFTLGGGKLAETILAKTGLQHGTQAVLDRVDPEVALKSVQDAGMFRVEADIERLAGNAKMVNSMLHVMLGNPSPRLHDDLVRTVEAFTEPQLREMAGALGVKDSDLNIAKLHEFVLKKLDDAKSEADLALIKKSNVRQAELVNLSREGNLPFSPNEKINEELNGIYKESLRSLLFSRSLKAMQNDPAGLGNALHSATGTVNYLSNVMMSQYADMLEAGIRRTSPKIQGSRKLLRAYRESLRFVKEHPELWVKEGDDVYKLSAPALAKVRKDAPKSIAMFERVLERATENGIDMEAVLERQGMMGSASEVVDGLTDIGNAMLTEDVRLGLSEEHLVNHFRRFVRMSKRPSKGTGGAAVKATVGGKSADDVEVLIRKAMDDALEADPSLGKAKGVESVNKLRRATEAQLVKAEEFGFIELEWDSLASMSDQIAGHQRSALARQFTDDLEMNLQNLDANAIEMMNKTKDMPFVPGFWKIGRKHMEAGKLTGNIPTVMKAEMRLVDGAKELLEPWQFMDKKGFKENGQKVFDDFYETFEVQGGVIVGDEFDQVRREVVRGAAKDTTFLRGEAKKKLVAELAESEELRKSLLKVTKSKGKPFTKDALESIVAGRVPKGVREPKQINKRITKEIDKRVAEAREKLVAAGKPTKRATDTLYVIKPMAGHLKDVLGLWDKHGMLSDKGIGGFQRFWRDTNHKLKAAKLNLSPFHFNVVSFAAILIDPVKAAKLVFTPVAKDYRATLLKFQAGGAAAGAAVGAGLGDDEESAVFGGVVGLIYGSAIGAAMRGAKSAKNYMFDPKMAPYMLRMGHQGWHGRPNDRSIGVMAQMSTRLSDKIKREHGQTVASRMLDGFTSVQMDFEKVMWDWQHNGSKSSAIASLMERSDAILLKEVDKGLLKMDSPEFIRRQREYDRVSMNTVNSAIGGFQASKLWNDPQWQFQAQNLLMSPDWTVGNILGAANIFMNQGAAFNAAEGALIGTVAELASVGFDPSELTGIGTVGGASSAVVLGKLAERAMARIMVGEAGGNLARAQSLKLYRNAILGGYAFGNLVNKMNTGHYMWENPEGKELSIAQPGGQVYVTLGKPYTEVPEFAAALDRSKNTVPILSRLKGKISPLGQVVVHLMTQEDGIGRPLMTVDQGPLEAAGSIASWAVNTVTPISLGRPIQAAVSIARGTGAPAGQQAASSALSLAGFAVSTERGGQLDPFLSGALEVTRPSPSGLGQLAAPSLAELVNPVNQRDFR